MSEQIMSEAHVPPLARAGGLRRMAHRRTDTAWLAEAWQRAKILVIDGGNARGGGPQSAQALLSDDHLLLVDPSEAPEGQRLFLGEDEEGTPYFAVTAFRVRSASRALPSASCS